MAPARRHRTGRWTGLLAAAGLVAALAGSARAAEEIIAYESDVVVADDGVLDVTETIRVRAEGDRIRRGIYRDFPLTFVDDAGGRHRVSFTLLEVTRNGAPESHHEVTNSRGVRIYAGDADVFVPAGVHTYRIRYQTGRQIRFFADHTELFWNVTGNEWVFPILSATARFALPQERAPLRWTAYTGRFGQRGEDFSARIVGDNVLVVETTRPLAPGEGLSVALDLPEGLLAPPSGLEALYYAYLDYSRFILGGLGLIGVLVFYAIAWNAVGRDPPKGTIIPLFRPPAGISPALAAYIHRFGWTSGWREFTAAAISLAVKGLLVFDDSGDAIVLERTDKAIPADDELPPGERSILKWIKRRRGRVVIDRASGASIAKARAAFKAAVEGENRHRFFNRNRGYFFFGLLLTALTLLAVLLFGGLDETELFVLAIFGFVGAVLGAVVVPMVRTVLGGRAVRSVIAAAFNVAIVAFIGTVIFTLARGALQALPDDFTHDVATAFVRNGFPFVLVGGFAAMNGLFYYLLRAPTAAGRKVMDDIEGLELYLRTAEAGRFNLAGAPDLDATQFERLLPYAIALGAEKPWSQAFAKAFARAHAGETTAVYAPAWHAGHGWGNGDLGAGLASTFSSAEGAFVSAMPAASSSSSGFGGGGGAGGGGGGGGGGGW